MSFLFLIVPRPPRFTRTNTLFPDTTLFRSRLAPIHVGHIAGQEDDRRPGACDMAIGEPGPAGAGEILHGGNIGHGRGQMTQSTVCICITAPPLARRCSTMIRLSRWIVSLPVVMRSEEHTSELQSLMRISYAVFCLKKKT